MTQQEESLLKVLEQMSPDERRRLEQWIYYRIKQGLDKRLKQSLH